MYRIQSTALTTSGLNLVLLPNAEITVFDKFGNLALTYQDEEGTAPLANPFSASEFGAYDFFVDFDDYYDLQISDGSTSVIERVNLILAVGEQGEKGDQGDDGKGFTGGSYDESTGTVTFASDDGIGFSTGDLRGSDGSDGQDGTDGSAGEDGADGEDGKGFSGGSYNPASGLVTFTSDDGLGFSTGDLRGTDGSDGADGSDGSDGQDGADGKGFTGGSYNSASGVVTFTSSDGLGFSTSDIRGADGQDGTDGTDGVDGTGVAILGSLASEDDLPDTGENGDAYLIDGDLYVWTGSDWDNVGSIQGPKGDPGEDGIIETVTYTDLNESNETEFWRSLAGGVNIPTPNPYVGYTVAFSDTIAFQSASRVNGDSTEGNYVRRKVGGVWEDWVNLATENTISALYQDSTTDTTEGKFLGPGSFGVGGQAIRIEDLDELDVSSFGSYTLGALNAPVANSAGTVTTMKWSDTASSQLAQVNFPPARANTLWARTKQASTWTDWVEVASSNNILDLFNDAGPVTVADTTVGIGISEPESLVHLKDGALRIEPVVTQVGPFFNISGLSESVASTSHLFVRQDASTRDDGFTATIQRIGTGATTHLNPHALSVLYQTNEGGDGEAKPWAISGQFISKNSTVTSGEAGTALSGVSVKEVQNNGVLFGGHLQCKDETGAATQGGMIGLELNIQGTGPDTNSNRYGIDLIARDVENVTSPSRYTAGLRVRCDGLRGGKWLTGIQVGDDTEIEQMDIGIDIRTGSSTSAGHGITDRGTKQYGVRALGTYGEGAFGMLSNQFFDMGADDLGNRIKMRYNDTTDKIEFFKGTTLRASINMGAGSSGADMN